MGVGVSHGVETIIHGLNRVISDPLLDPSSVIMLVDFKNAFNEVNRQSFINEVHDRLPEIFPWVYYSYGGPALLFSGEDVIDATTGVQGDPLGPLLFSLALQPT